jgi:hypothetical protein
VAELAVIGTLISAGGTILSGVAANNQAKSEALAMEAQGREEFAASQREAEQKKREGRIAMSRQQAVAAASGGGADDASIIKLMTRTAGESDFNARTVMYGGEQRKRGLFDSARNRRTSGQASLLGSVFAATGQAFKGLGSSGGSF